MSTHVETTAVMSPPAEPDAASVTAGAAAASAAGSDPEIAAPPADASHPEPQRAEREPVSLSVVISVFGGLTAAVITVLGGLLVWQLSAMNQNIDSLRTEMRSEFRSEIGGLRTEIGGLRTELRSEFRSEIGGLRSEMQAGFREVNATLLDHTERFARLETWAGLNG